jgi:hypothetical protein
MAELKQRFSCDESSETFTICDYITQHKINQHGLDTPNKWLKGGKKKFFLRLYSRTYKTKTFIEKIIFIKFSNLGHDNYPQKFFPFFWKM